MRLLILLLLVGVAITSVFTSALPDQPIWNITGLPCGFPYPASVLHEYNVEARAVPGQLKNLGSRSATSFGHRDFRPTPWPVEEEYYYTIPYCYLDAGVRAALKTKVDEAIQIWYNALGGTIGRQSGHRVSFVEMTEGEMIGEGDPAYCHIIDENGNRLWNEHVRSDAVNIHLGDGAMSAATVGHFAIPGYSIRGLNLLSAGREAPASAIAHELGHTMGMVHEHQRTDRDLYVKYKCEKVIGYAQKVVEARQDPQVPQGRDAAQLLCTDAAFAQFHDFRGVDYVKGWTFRIEKHPTEQDEDEVINIPVQSENSNYDVDSIMHYATHDLDNGDPACEAGNIDPCVLVKYKDPWNKAAGVEEIPAATTPSAGDVAWVKRYYGW